MALKVTMFIKAATNYEQFPNQPGRIAGESESWYLDVSSPPTNLSAIVLSLVYKRAACLPVNAAVNGYRTQTVNLTAGPSQPFKCYAPGNASFPCDVPQMTLKIPCRSTNGLNKKTFEMRVVPDSQIVTGEFSPSPAYQAALTALLSELNTGWCFRGKKLDAATSGINYIEDDGTFHLWNDFAYNIGDPIQILRTNNLASRQKGGIYQVNAKTDARTGKVANWNHGLCTGGKIRQVLYIYPPVAFAADAVFYAESMVKKVGRPTDLYRGRKSARKPG